jgi:hypothetical protein
MLPVQYDDGADGGLRLPFDILLEIKTPAFCHLRFNSIDKLAPLFCVD